MIKEFLEKYKKQLSLGFLVILFISIVLVAVLPTNPNGNSTNPTPVVSVTATPTINSNLPSINFSGFLSNINLSLKDFQNLSSTITKANVYYAINIDKNYFVNTLKFQGNGSFYQNSEYTLEISPERYSILTNKAQMKVGSINDSTARSNFLNFYKNKLNLDSSTIDFTITKSNGLYSISGIMKVDNVYTYSLDKKPSFIATMSTSGQVLNMYIYNLFIISKTIGSYELNIPIKDVIKYKDPYQFGVWVDLSNNISSTTSLFTDSVNVSDSKFGYYFDTTSGYVIPILKVDGNFYAYNNGNSYNARLLFMLVDNNKVVRVTPVPVENNLE